MSDVKPSESISQVIAADKKGEASEESPEQPEKEEQHPQEEDHETGKRSVADVALVMGIPVEAVTPQIQEGLNNILNEFDRHRQELESQKKRISFLEKSGDSHAFLPVMNRRALERALAKILNRIEQTYSDNCFVCFQIDQIETILREQGLVIAESVLADIANTIKGGLRASDTIGSLAGFGLGVIFTVTTRTGAEEKAQSIVLQISEKLKLTYPQLKLMFGIHMIKPGDDIGKVIAAADQDLRNR